jgi:hypothetical protein
MPVLRRTVDHFEAAVECPWSLDRMGETARAMAGLEGEGAYGNAPLAAAMRALAR